MHIVTGLENEFTKWNITTIDGVNNPQQQSSQIEIRQIIPSLKNSFIWTTDDDRIFTIGKPHVPNLASTNDDNVEEQLISNPLNCVEWKWKERARRYLRMNEEMAEYIDSRLLNVKNVYASCFSVFLDLGDGVFFASNEHEDRMWKLQKEIRLFVTSSSSNHALIVFGKFSYLKSGVYNLFYNVFYRGQFSN